MRQDQIVGLNEWSRKFVEGEKVLLFTERITRIYPDGKKEELPPCPVYGSSIKKEESGETYEGMFGEKYPLYKYTFPDGRVYYEKVQRCIWSSGPVFFLALQDEEGNWVPESLWTEEEIRDCLL